jgi:ABC-2 type transport system permease protein
MKNLVVAELAKLRTTRTPYLLLAGAVALAVTSVLDPGRDATTFRQPFHEQTFVFFTSFLVRILVLVMGVRAITDELRHGTIVSTLVVTPRRGRVIAAKAVAVGAAGAVVAVAGWLAMTGAAAVVADMDGTVLRLRDGGLRSLAGSAGAGVAWALVGLGLGAIVRSQLAATVGGLVWLMGLEDAVRGWVGDLATYLPGQAGLALAVGSSERALAAGGVTMAVYAALALAAGTALMRRDVT